MSKVLYILMRSDMESLNPGKAMAQAAHAANLFAENIDRRSSEYKEWINEGNGFGTTIVLDAYNDDLLNSIINDYKEKAPTGIVLDNTYPILDGDVVHLLPVQTCGYIFIDQEIAQLGLLQYMELYP